MSSLEKVQRLLREVGPGRMVNTAYDTAWIARLFELGDPMGEVGLSWLREHQMPDGSWGARVPCYHHDRLVSTLAAVIALARKGDEVDRSRIRRARMAIDSASKGLTADFVGETIGFEMIVPTLLAEAQELGVLRRSPNSVFARSEGFAKESYQLFGKEDTQLRRRTDHYIKRLTLNREKKIQLLPAGKVNRYVTVAFSAEMAGTDGVQMFDIENLLQSNGSVAYSPSATAYYALYINPGDPRPMHYLNQVTRQNRGGAPDVAPFDIFEPAWVLWNLALIQDLDAETLELCQPHLDFLQQAWLPGVGAGFAAEYPPKDGDETSLTFDVLSQFGRKVDFEAVLQYEQDEYFRCFDLEANPSVSANIHVLGALRQQGYEFDSPCVNKVVEFLWNTQLLDMFWFDKWHVSPYYPTTHAVINAIGYVDELVLNALTWILDTQNEDGSWGYYLPTAEETAYSIQALIITQRYHRVNAQNAIRRGLDWLADHTEPPYPPLWIGKCLYCPELVVRSTILSALILGEQEGFI